MDKIDNQTIKVLCLIHDQYAHIKPIELYMGAHAEFVYDTTHLPEQVESYEPDIVLCVSDSDYMIMQCLKKAKELRIPTLMLQDGILEWRCQFDDLRHGEGGGPPIFQPVLADKVACLGPQSARQISMWGNRNKVEVTGSPRLDHLTKRQKTHCRKPGKRVLVMTSNTPWFSEEQKKVTIQSLQDVNEWFQQNQPDVEIYWRVTKNLEETLNVQNSLNEKSSSDLASVIDQCDAIITTPSTTILEGMLMHRPVAVLDYHNVPIYVNSAWRITAKCHIASIVREILKPQERKMQFQSECLFDALRTEKAAAENVSFLIVKMVECVRQGRSLHSNLMQYNAFDFHSEHMPRLERLYPHADIFKEKNVESLQLRLCRAERAVLLLKRKLRSRSLGFWIESFFRYVYRKIKK